MSAIDKDLVTDAVLLSLGKRYADGYDVDGISSEVIDKYGYLITSRSVMRDGRPGLDKTALQALWSDSGYWDIVARHDRAAGGDEVQAASLARAANLRSLAELREDRDQIQRLQAELEDALRRRKRRVTVLLAAKSVPVADVIEATGLKKQRLYQLYDRDGAAQAAARG